LITDTWRGWLASLDSARLTSLEATTLVGCIELAGPLWSDASVEAEFSGDRPAPGPAPPTFSSIHLRSIRRTKVGPGHEISWPWIQHSTAWGYERALHWLAEVEPIWKDPGALFGSWISVMTAQLFDAPTARQRFDRPTRPFAGDWTSLADRLAELESGPLTEGWLDAVGLLCTPEMGFPKDELNQIRWPLPPGRAERIQRLRESRTPKLPESIRAVVGSWFPGGPSPDAAVRTPEDRHEP
jgi:hypothetical protein